MEKQKHQKTVSSFHQKKRKKQAESKYKQRMGNQKSGQGFAQLQKDKVMREYRKILRKEKLLKHTEDGNTSQSRKQVKQTAFIRAQKEFSRKQTEKQHQEEVGKKEREGRQEAMAKYKQKKNNWVKHMSKRNYKGQPNMGSQMEYLLQKIQRDNTDKA